MRKKRIGLFTGFILISGLLIAQQKNGSSIEAKNLKSLFRFQISWDCGLIYEKTIGPTSTVILFTGIDIGRATDDFTNIKARLQFIPAAFAEYRNNYDIKKRIERNKIILNNSANFLFGRLETFFRVKNQNDFNLLLIQGWGLQRCINKKFSADCHIGIVEHFYYDAPPSGGFNYIKFEPMLMFSFSYVF